MKELLDRIRNEKDDLYPDRLKSEEKAKQGYDTCQRALPAPAQISDLKLQVLADASRLTFLANGRVFATADIHDFQNGAPIQPADIVYGRNSVAVRLGWAKDMFTIFQVRETDGKLCSKQLFVALRDGDGITISTANVGQDSTTFGIVYGRKRDLYNEYVARNSDLTFLFDPRAPRTGRSRAPTTPIAGSIEKHGVTDHGCS